MAEEDKCNSVCDSESTSCDTESCDSSGQAKLYNEIIRPPIPGNTLAYIVQFDKMALNINNGYMTPVPNYYEYKLCNTLSLITGDTIKLSITVPKQLTGCANGYEIPVTSFVNLVASLKIEAVNHCDTYSLTTTPTLGNSVNVVDNCGWLTFELTVVLPYDYNDICMFCYSICFQGLRLTSLYGKCRKINCDCKRKKCRRSYDTIKMESNTCLELTAYLPPAP